MPADRSTLADLVDKSGRRVRRIQVTNPPPREVLFPWRLPSRYLLEPNSREPFQYREV